MLIPTFPTDARAAPPRRGGWLAATAAALLLAAGSLAAPEAGAQSSRKATPAQKEAELKKVNAPIERVRRAGTPKRDADAWLAFHFPIYYERAGRVLARLPG